MDIDNISLKKVFDHLSHSVLVFDDALSLVGINSAGEALLGNSAHKLLGTNADRLFLNDEYWLGIIQMGVKEQLPFTERGVTLTSLDKEPLSVDVNISPCGDADSNSGIVVELFAVDKRTQIMRDEQFLNQHATVHAMLRGLAHEIRNPLGGLRGAAQLLEGELENEALKEYTHVIIGEADRLQKLLDRMLGPRSMPHKQLVNIHEIAGRVCKLIMAEMPETITLLCDYDPSIPDLMLDQDLMIQALLNLARNAIQALNDKGTLMIRTRVQRNVIIGQQHHRLALQLDVIDDGPGIPSELMETMFYPMVSGRAEGTGLGLSIAQNLVQQHNGLIHCDSRTGKTVMSIILPLEETS